MRHLRIVSLPIRHLKRDRTGSVAYRHPWVFSGALEEPPERSLHGRAVQVVGADGAVLGTGTYSASSSIAVRLFSFGPAPVTLDRPWLARAIAAADARRRVLGYGPDGDTTGYRVVFGESDGLPGLIVDRYEHVLVFQISTAGMDALRQDLIDVLLDLFKPSAIVERSDLTVRREERLESVEATHHGEPPARVPFQEWGVPLLADVLHGQKTGFFLDQKDLRALARRLAAGRESVLNLFSYTGATGLAAALGGAARVHNVDGSESALAHAREHAALVDLPDERFTLERADVFQWLGNQTEPAYDMVLLDPPALIKGQKDIDQGRRAYHFLNRAALRLVRDGGLLFTSSCSYYFSEDDLAFELRRAATAAGVTLHTLATVRQSGDHPLSIYFPESLYLKSLVLEVRR